ncbi:MAG: SIMPL domain-containing protein [Armatimonadota bacterium]
MRFTLRTSNFATAVALSSFAAMTAAGSVLTLSSPAYAQETARETDSALNGIVVSGTGEVQVKPDIARISLGVQNQGREASGVTQENAQKTDALIKAVKAAGVADKDIQTSGYSIYPQYEQNQLGGFSPSTGMPREPKIVGYQASNMVTVTVRKVGDTGRIIDAAIKAGGNTSNGITFDVADKASSGDAALQKAVADAVRKAKVIAKAAGAANLFLVGIQEGGYTPPRPMYGQAMMARGADVASTPVQPGEQSVTANVAVRFRFSGEGTGSNFLVPGIKIPLGN